MAGGGGGGGNSRDLDRTPTWAVAAVCGVIIIISLLLEKGLHHIGEWLAEKHKKALFKALEKIKAELMILGFISLLLTFGQNQIIKICIREKVANTMLPCPVKNTKEHMMDAGNHRRLLWSALMKQDVKRRFLAADLVTGCPSGKEPLISTNGLHQLHMFIFFLAVAQVANSGLTMALGKAKIRRWKEWEKETTSVNYELSNDPSRFRFAQDTSFVRQHSSLWNRITILFYIVSFFRQFFRSVRKTDYLTLRHGFISAHLAPGSKFNFQRYINRSLEDDFTIVVGISPVLWASAVIVLLLNVYDNFGGRDEASGDYLKNGPGNSRDTCCCSGNPLIKVSDEHFWFGRPEFVLFLIHFSLFQNAFQLTYFLWISYSFGLNSCFHKKFNFVIARIGIGVGIQILCSYVTLPLYALVSQMGSHMKTSIFDEQTSKALKRWHQSVKKRQKQGSAHSTTSRTPGDSPLSTPGQTPVHRLHRYKTMGYAGEASQRSTRRRFSDRSNSDSETEMNAPVNSSRGGREPTQSPEHLIDVQNPGGDDFTFAKPSADQTKPQAES